MKEITISQKLWEEINKLKHDFDESISRLIDVQTKHDELNKLWEKEITELRNMEDRIWNIVSLMEEWENER